MKQEILVQFPHLWMPIVALILFFFTFVGAYLYAFDPKKKKVYDYTAHIPFEDAELKGQN